MSHDLIGCVVVTDRDGVRTSGRIVEAEAYAGAEDPASHAATQRTGPSSAMAGPAGIAYVYRSYGIHVMLNVVCDAEGVSSAALIRALEPLDGIEQMRQRRGGVADGQLCAGPGRLCQALAIRLGDHGRDLITDDELWIEPGQPAAPVVASARIGITRGLDRPWRFFEAGSRWVSAHRRGELIDWLD